MNAYRYCLRKADKIEGMLPPVKIILVLIFITLSIISVRVWISHPPAPEGLCYSSFGFAWDTSPSTCSHSSHTLVVSDIGYNSSGVRTAAVSCICPISYSKYK